MGAYSSSALINFTYLIGWAVIRGWALNQINTVISKTESSYRLFPPGNGRDIATITKQLPLLFNNVLYQIEF